MKTLADLRMMLNAVQIVRKRWLDLIDIHARELMRERLMPLDRARHQVLLHPEVFAEYTNLISLYGIIGDEAAQHVTALDSVVEPSKDFLKRAS